MPTCYHDANYFFGIIVRTLAYLMKHLARVAEKSTTTGMTPKNMAIVWAPNLIRSKELEAGGVAALKVKIFFIYRQDIQIFFCLTYKILTIYFFSILGHWCPSSCYRILDPACRSHI